MAVNFQHTAGISFGGLHRDNGKENGSYCITGLYGVIWGLYRDNGNFERKTEGISKENSSRVQVRKNPILTQNLYYIQLPNTQVPNY